MMRPSPFAAPVILSRRACDLASRRAWRSAALTRRSSAAALGSDMVVAIQKVGSCRERGNSRQNLSRHFVRTAVYRCSSCGSRGAQKKFDTRGSNFKLCMTLQNFLSCFVGHHKQLAEPVRCAVERRCQRRYRDQVVGQSDRRTRTHFLRLSVPRTSSLRSGILTMWKSSPYSS